MGQCFSYLLDFVNPDLYFTLYNLDPQLHSDSYFGGKFTSLLLAGDRLCGPY